MVGVVVSQEAKDQRPETSWVTGIGVPIESLTMKSEEEMVYDWTVSDELVSFKDSWRVLPGRASSSKRGGEAVVVISWALMKGGKKKRMAIRGRIFFILESSGSGVGDLIGIVAGFLNATDRDTIAGVDVVAVGYIAGGKYLDWGVAVSNVGKGPGGKV